jgi:hypothetical protein
MNKSAVERAILYSIQDTPVMIALGKYREEALLANDGHQIVRGSFDSAKALSCA